MRILDGDKLLDLIKMLYVNKGWGFKEVHFSYEDLEKNVDVAYKKSANEVNMFSKAMEDRENGTVPFKEACDQAYYVMLACLMDLGINEENTPNYSRILEYYRGFTIACMNTYRIVEWDTMVNTLEGALDIMKPKWREKYEKKQDG